MINITLPWPPSVNTYWRNVYGRTLISRKGREYRRAVIAEIIAQKATQGLTGPISVFIEAHPPDRRKRDLDNLLKSLLDSMEHACVFQSDSQINELYIKRKEQVEGGLVEVCVMPAPDQVTA